MAKAAIILRNHKVRNTEMRRKVLDIFLSHQDKALSSQDIEEIFNDIDRVTLYRVLKTFEESGVIHRALDGSSKNKYALCSDNCDSSHHNDRHAHFRCQKCDMTTCMDNVEIPNINVPNGFSLNEAQLVLSGLCPECNN